MLKKMMKMNYLLLINLTKQQQKKTMKKPKKSKQTELSFYWCVAIHQSTNKTTIDPYWIQIILKKYKETIKSAIKCLWKKQHQIVSIRRRKSPTWIEAESSLTECFPFERFVDVRSLIGLYQKKINWLKRDAVIGNEWVINCE